MAPRPDGGGSWFVAADGGGSWFVAADGGVCNLGDAAPTVGWAARALPTRWCP